MQRTTCRAQQPPLDPQVRQDRLAAPHRNELNVMNDEDSAKSVDVDQPHTFVFADLAGFTALTEAHGDQEAADLALDFAAKVREWLESVGGGDLKLVGDAAMVRCSSARAAVELALLIVERLHRLGDYPAVRIGLNTGPAAARDGDWFGSTVNVAARVAAHAEASEVLVTEATRRSAGDDVDVTWEPQGEHQFRNVREPVHIFRATRPNAEADNLVTDPVCRMRIDPHEAAGTLRHEESTYSFCSLTCASAFASSPTDYIG